MSATTIPHLVIVIAGDASIFIIVFVMANPIVNMLAIGGISSTAVFLVNSAVSSA